MNTMSSSVIILLAFSTLATASATELTFAKFNRNSYVGIGQQNYALTGPIIADKDIKTLSVNGDLVSIVTPDCTTTIRSLQALDSQLRQLVEDLRSKGSSYNDGSSFEQNLVVDNEEIQMFRTKISKDSPNRSVITLSRDIRSVSSAHFPESLARIVADGDIVSFINYDGAVEMKPVVCLSEEERQIVDKIRDTKAWDGIKSEEVDGLRRRLRTQEDKQNSEQAPERITNNPANDDTSEYARLNSRLETLERKVEVGFKMEVEENNYLTGNLSNLVSQNEEWRNQQSKLYAELRSRLQTEYDNWSKQQSQLYEQLRSKLLTDFGSWTNEQSKQYAELRSNLKMDFDNWTKQQSQLYEQLRSNLKTDFGSWTNEQSKQYAELRSNLKMDFDSWTKQQSQLYAELRSKLHQGS